MNVSFRAAFAGAFAVLSSIAPAHAAADGATVIAAAYSRNDALQAYTFHMNVAMAMRHFPWLHFKMDGVGTYLRGERYAVHFTNMPSFASGKIHDVDLSMIDPSMWPKHYRYEEVAQQSGDTLFALQGVADESLKNATVAMNPSLGAQWVDATYSDGTHIHMTVNSSDLDGFLLPATLNAQVDYPHMPLSADADFTDYNITPSVH